MTQTTSSTVHENLDTSYLNLAALLRYLQQREFVGRVHVELIEYEADVYLNAQEAQRIREINHSTGHVGEGEEAMQRLLVRAIEPGGLVSVYSGVEEELENMPLPLPNLDIEFGEVPNVELSPDEQERRELLHISGELIAAIERACDSAGADFESLFRGARLELSDDYSFLDPLTGRFEYDSGGVVRVHGYQSPDAIAGSICECMRRVVAKTATGERGGGVRERVALELAVLARRRQSQLTRFKLIQNFDRIAGTRVL